MRNDGETYNGDADTMGKHYIGENRGADKMHALERRLLRDGYIFELAMTYDMHPEDLTWPKNADGWEKRRILKTWCAKHGITDYVIVRNDQYVKDLRGVVYDLHVKRASA